MNLNIILTSLWIYLPSYTANSAPVAFGGGPPLDAGENWLDGKPVLGSHKTLRGCIVGILGGLLIGTLQGNLLSGLAQGIGAILGDLVSSFFKRRWDVAPGESYPLLDQLDFIVGAVVLSQPFTRATLAQIIVILVITVPIHYMSNYLSWKLKMKEHPW